jgi:hypothetical protein
MVQLPIPTLALPRSGSKGIFSAFSGTPVFLGDHCTAISFQNQAMDQPDGSGLFAE